MTGHALGRRVLALVSAGALLVSLVAMPSGAGAEDSTVQKVADGRLRAAQITPAGGTTKTAPTISPGTLAAVRGLTGANAQDIREEEADAANPNDTALLAIAQGTLGCGRRDPDRNVRVNQDCTFRRQAEELIKVNPANTQNLIAGQNDSRIGFNHCGFDFSFDGGLHWGDGIPPFFQKVNNPNGQKPTPSDPNSHTILGGRGTFHTYDAASDPAVAFDSQGQAFFSCVLFDVFSDASALAVTSSPVGAGGSFYNNLATTTRRFVVAEDNSPHVFHDKEFIAADSFASSPNRDNVYVTWTVFRFSPNCGPQPNPSQEERFCAAPIFGSMSTDHAVTWSTPEEISGTSTTLCFFGNFFDPTRDPHACDIDQGSDPQPLPNGDLVVVFNNFNTAADNPNNQQLSVKCHPTGSSRAGTAHLNCAAPAKVGDDVVVGEPQCDFGRGPEECIPGAFIRTNDFPRIAIDKANGNLFAAWQDYRTGQFDIHLAESEDGGRTWAEAEARVNPDTGRDHYFAAIDVGTDHKVAVSYFRTERVPNENPAPGVSGLFAPGQPGVQDEPSNYFLAGGRRLKTPFRDVRVSPDFPPPDGIQAGFNGDYSGLVVVGEIAHPIWSDTRNTAVVTSPNQGVVHDEDIFTDRVEIPSGD